MREIDTPDAVAQMPVPLPAGMGGWFSNGVPGQSLATEVTADWLNSIQAELLNLLAAIGLQPNANQFNQILNAIMLIGTGPGSLAIDTGAVNQVVVTLQPITSGYVTGQIIYLKPVATNTGPVQIQVMGPLGQPLGQKQLLRPDGSQLVQGNLQAGLFTPAIYNGAAWQLFQTNVKEASYLVDQGAVNAIAGVLNPAPFAAPTAGAVIRIMPAFPNNAACTIAINGAPPVSFLRQNGTAMVQGDVQPGVPLEAVYTGNSWQALAPSPSMIAAIAAAMMTAMTQALPAAMNWGNAPLTAAATLAVSNGYFINTSAGAFTLTMPANPNLGDQVAIEDVAGTFAVNNLTLAPNAGGPIMGQNQAMIVSNNFLALTFRWSGATGGWRIV